jgi:hypothetical protein
MKNFSILIGYEQCDFFEIQCQEMKYSAKKEMQCKFLKVPMQRNFTQRFLDCIAKII